MRSMHSCRNIIFENSYGLSADILADIFKFQKSSHSFRSSKILTFVHAHTTRDLSNHSEMNFTKISEREF